MRNWTPVHTRNLDDESVTERIEDLGHGKIASLCAELTLCILD
jgi:hypothetical protein